MYRLGAAYLPAGLQKARGCIAVAHDSASSEELHAPRGLRGDGGLLIERVVRFVTHQERMQ
jgi:hypothetical protein